MKQRWIFLVMKGMIHKEDTHHKPLDTLTYKDTQSKNHKEYKGENV